MSYGMRAKPKKGGAVDRQRLTPLTTGARQTPLYGNKGIGGQDATGLRKHTKKGLQYDDRRVDQGESPMRPDLEAKLQLENSVTTLLLEGGEADWKYEITPYVPGECHPVVTVRSLPGLHLAHVHGRVWRRVHHRGSLGQRERDVALEATGR